MGSRAPGGPLDPKQFRALLSPGPVGISRPSWPHIALPLWAKASFQLWADLGARLGEKLRRLYLNPSFSLAWSGSWEETSGRPGGEFVTVAALLAHLKRGSASTASFLGVAVSGLALYLVMELGEGFPA